MKALHLIGDGATRCGLTLGDLPPGHGLTASEAGVTCDACEATLTPPDPAAPAPAEARAFAGALGALVAVPENTDSAPPTPTPAEGFKVCTNPACRHAGDLQPLDAFHRRSDTRDGRQSWCKTCVADAAGDKATKRARARAWAKADAETRKRHARTWNAAYKRALKAEGIKP